MCFLGRWKQAGHLSIAPDCQTIAAMGFNAMEAWRVYSVSALISMSHLVYSQVPVPLQGVRLLHRCCHFAVS